MQSLTQITGIISFLAGIGCMIWFLICLIRKKPKKKSLYGVGVCVAVFFLSFVVSMATMTPEERAAMDQRIQEKRELEAQQKAEKAAQKAADEAMRAKKAADEKEAKEAAKAAEEAAKEAERAQKEAEQIKKDSERGGVFGFFKGLFSSKPSNSGDSADKIQSSSPAISNVDWSKAITQTKSDILAQEKLVADVDIQVDNSNKTIIISLVCNNAINQNAMVEAVDTAVRRLSANAQMQNSSIQSGGKDYWGGIWDVYTLDMRVSKNMYVDDPSKWSIRDVVQPGVQGNHKFKAK